MRVAKSKSNYSSFQTERLLDPEKFIAKNLKKINSNKISLGLNNHNYLLNNVRPNSAAVVGAALGDEGKGRIVDNKIQSFLSDHKIKNVAVIRFQGGNNAGHTVEKDKIKLALHLIPSGVLHKNAINIIDRGVVVHPEDLIAEINYVESRADMLNGNLFVSDDAILCTDLERAEEILNRLKTNSAKGGTGRGIGPAYAHHYDRLGLKLHHLLENDWEDRLSAYYIMYKKIFKAFNLSLNDVEIPDYPATLKNGKSSQRIVDSKNIFIKRLGKARKEFIKRKLAVNTFSLHRSVYEDQDTAVLFEGAQAAGLDGWLGTFPDVTSSNTSVFGIREGTGFWRAGDIEKVYGVFKIPYTSSVGSRIMPTHINLSKINAGKSKMTEDQKWAAWVREDAHEYGTTTGRPRDILHLDLPMLSYNVRMAGINMLIGTHLDTARESDKIKICTHYESKKGTLRSYQPGLRHLKDVVPNYIELPGWDGIKCRQATSISELPINALKFLSFIENQTGYPIVAVTTGPDRSQMITFPGY